MKLEILGAESLGVRSLCCSVHTKHRRILIDPGIALGYMRHKLLPHPIQIGVDETIREKIIQAWRKATDIVISHFHGDHVPLADANPYQLSVDSLKGLNPNITVWTKAPAHLSSVERPRAASLSRELGIELQPAEGCKSGSIRFSMPVPHGESHGNTESVIMTRVEEDSVFVHASDIQLLDDRAVTRILDWGPDIVIAGGPPIYLDRLSDSQIHTAWSNALRLSRGVNQLIIDHHLLRSSEGPEWLEQLSLLSGKQVMCAADFMKQPRLLLEADRDRLYQVLPVPKGWHEEYANGKQTYRGDMIRSYMKSQSWYKKIKP